MKTSAVNNTIINKQIAFKGHSAFTNDKGKVGHKFYLPFDSTKYNVELEINGFEKVNGKWRPIEELDVVRIPMNENGINIPEDLLYTEDGTATGYRFLLSEKNNPNKKFYKIDSGLQSNPSASSSEDTYSLLLPNRTVLSVNGLTKQVMPDITFPGYSINQKTGELIFDKEERNRAVNAMRTHGNKLGGNIAGIMRMLPVWKQEGYTKLVGTPYTKDEVSSHLYWTENPYQVSASMGTLEDFKAFQRELFKNGQNFIADGAFVNQGLQGTLFKSVLKHGEDSPFFNWFKASGLLSSDLKLGAIPSNPEARANFRFKLVNAPKKFEFDFKEGTFKAVRNKNYDKTKLSYIQLFDKRLVTQEEANDSQKLLTRYSKTNTENPYDITGHDDVTQLLSFEINPYNFYRNMINVINKTIPGKRDFKNTEFVESILTFDNFKITTKDKGGVDLWDGNMDIAKLNFYNGNTDQAYLEKFTNPYEKRAKAKELKGAIYQVQDFALSAARYWTKLVADTQIEYVAKTLKDAEPTIIGFKKEIAQQVAKGNLPEKAKELMTEDLIKNVFNGEYDFNKPETPFYLEERRIYIQNEIMKFPLESIELSPDLVAVLASPYITKRATKEEDLFKNRHETFVETEIGQGPEPTKYTRVYNKMDKVITKEFTDYVVEILDLMQERLPEHKRLFDQKTYKITEYGQHVLNHILPDIIKFAVVKSFAPQARVSFDNNRGVIDYSEANTQDISLKTLKINGSPETEAEKTVFLLRKGLENVYNSNDKRLLAKVLAKRISPLDTIHFKVAAAIVDQTQSGLGWRIDAAKDIANIDALRTQNDNDERLLDAVSDFWGKFNQVVKEENKHSYTTAEITDLDKVLITKNGDFDGYVDAETQFIEKTGLNNTANYMFFYSMLKNLFARNGENGIFENFNDITELHRKLAHGWPENGKKISYGFLFQYPDDGVANSYTFVGNHDKPRVLHLFALDMDLFHSNFSNPKHLERAKNILGNKADFRPDQISGKAIAMGERLHTAIYEIKEKFNLEDKHLEKFRDAIANLASGQFKKKRFNPDAFGTRDFRHAIEHVFEEAEQLGFKHNNTKEIKNAMLENILTPAMDKAATVYKMLVTLPGSPTDFIGDKEGCSGYETKSNNDFQQNRNTVPFEWISSTLKDKNIDNSQDKKFVNDYYNEMTRIGALRNRKELSALTNGHTVALPIQQGKDEYGNDVNVAATFRYDDKGSQVICLYTTAGASSDAKDGVFHRYVNLKELILDTFYWKEGIKGGLTPGDIFKNANGDETYKVIDDNGCYKLIRINSVYKDISIKPEDKNTAVLYKVNPKVYEPRLIYPNMNY